MTSVVIDPVNVSVGEAARALGVSPRFLRGLIAKGEFPMVRLGRRTLVPLDELRKWNAARVQVGS